MLINYCIFLKGYMYLKTISIKKKTIKAYEWKQINKNSTFMQTLLITEQFILCS